MKTLKLALVALMTIGLSYGTVSAQDAGKPAKKTEKKANTSSTAAPAQHLKKDGTPDMRYKENKQAAQKSTDTKSSAGTTGTTGTTGKSTKGTTKTGGKSTKGTTKK